MERSNESYRMDRQGASALIGCWERDPGGAHPTYSQALTPASLLAPAPSKGTAETLWTLERSQANSPSTQAR